MAILRSEGVADGWLIITSQAPNNLKLTDFFNQFIDVHESRVKGKKRNIKQQYN